ncbi:hypothetical protein C8Q75DRAFT_806199 [Abortiporus biennis]|nr:hypothetical protein C8Q75DRAFT_806199 [Abortiporus biennis]
MAGERTFSFWGMVGAVMLALKLKDHIDDYRQVPDTEAGPVHLRSPMDENSPYHDDDDVATLRGIDTEIPGARPTKKRSRDCCLCCGMRCGLFWKAFGIVCALVLGWQLIKLIIWAVTPSPTGLENMPQYSKSLGCENTKFHFGDDLNIYTLSLNAVKADHSIDFRGAAVGTLLIAEGDAESTSVKLELKVGTNDESLVPLVSVTYPDSNDIEEGTADSRFLVSTPPHILAKTSCMRFDATLFLPPNLKKLHVIAHATTQVRFDENANVDLDRLFVTLYPVDPNSMILPNTGIRAKEMDLEMARGWLVGDASIVDRTTITTQRGDAVSNVKLHPVASSDGTSKALSVQTTTGAGRSDFFFIGHPSDPHRPIHAAHYSSRRGDIYLTYKDAEFSGTVDLQASSYTATGVQGMSFNRTADSPLPWVGDQNGPDTLKVKTSGWAGLYFQ